MAEVDTRLEEALEAVLVRYGIPPAGLSAAVGLWDRGDLSSDLADAARRAATTVDVEGYERHLAAVYADLKAIYEAHPEHVVSFATADGTCRVCGEPVRAEARESRCGGPDPTDRCDELGGLLYGRMDAAFPPEDAERWLAAWPAADFLEWGTDGGGIPGDGSLRAWIAETMQHDAIDRMLGWENLTPADPATTRPDTAEPDATAV